MALDCVHKEYPNKISHALNSDADVKPPRAAPLRIRRVKRDRDAVSRPFEAFHPMLKPSRKHDQVTHGRCEWHAHPGAHPRKVNGRGFIHRDRGATRIAKHNLSALHIRWDLHVIGGREERYRMAMEHVLIARLIHVNPAPQPEIVLLSALRRTEVVQEGLNVLLHLIMEFGDHGIIEIEEIERVMPASDVGPKSPVATVPHPLCEFL